MIYTQRAKQLEASNRHKEAEQLYVQVHEYDLAINMYKKAKMFDQMIRLVSLYRKDLLSETHLHLAQQLENEGLLSQVCICVHALKRKAHRSWGES